MLVSPPRNPTAAPAQRPTHQASVFVRSLRTEVVTDTPTSVTQSPAPCRLIRRRADSFQVGSRVQALYAPTGTVFPACIAATHANGSYTVAWDDGDNRDTIKTMGELTADAESGTCLSLTLTPTMLPTYVPTAPPTVLPSFSPSTGPTISPSVQPTQVLLSSTWPLVGCCSV